ncbi:MAG: hypothetical protein A2Y61_06830 [Chloroflexi bacterium RBG_13_60_13]|nr:MAG: hypothetical protein A2Y61_06830 [Chloroflexi bacterium RBG_13_60_13]
MAARFRRVGVIYTASSRDILAWFIRTAILSVLTLGLYLPVAANKLVAYLCAHTELYIGESELEPTPQAQHPAPALEPEISREASTAIELVQAPSGS